MKQLSNLSDKRLDLIREKLQHLNTWKLVAGQVQDFSRLSAESIDDALSKVDAFSSHLKEIDDNLADTAKRDGGEEKAKNSDLARLTREVEEARQNILQSIEEISSALCKERESILKEVEKIRMMREVAHSYRNKEEGEGRRIDGQG